MIISIPMWIVWLLPTIPIIISWFILANAPEEGGDFFPGSPPAWASGLFIASILIAFVAWFIIALLT